MTTSISGWRFAAPRPWRRIAAAVLAAALGWAAATLRAQTTAQAFTDRTTYNAGSAVQLNVLFPLPMNSLPSSMDLTATIRYAAQSGPPVGQYRLLRNFSLSQGQGSTGYHALWKIPFDATTGRYAVDLVGTNVQTHEIFLTLPNAASFAIYRKLVMIERIELDKTFYTSGDEVACQVVVRNLTEELLRGLRVEFSDRYWPWIGNPDPSTVHAVPLSESFSLVARGEQTLHSGKAAEAPDVQQPAVRQYAVVVWDRERKNIYDIGFSNLVFVRPPGATQGNIYPPQFIYSSLADVNTTAYRQFYPPELNSAAIQFDHSHTMYPTGAEVSVKFSLSNSTDAPWRGVSVLARLIAPDGTEAVRNVVDEKLDLIPGADPLNRTALFNLPAGTSGLYRARVQVTNTFGQVLATNDLELAANPLPQSILVFCAHEDDEGGWSGLTRAAVENNIPIHFVYFTGGDAGSCDRYYQHSCSPADALYFGSLRMEETRASLGHLGVARENIFFLGLPDGGSGGIWYDHPDAKQPYLSVLLASDHSPYAEAAWPNLPYARQPVVDKVEAYVRQFQPEVIVTAHPPNQEHVDHIVNNYFVVEGLRRLLRHKVVSPGLEVRVDRVYDPKQLPQTPYQFEERNFYVSGDAVTLAQEAWWFYPSQGGNRAQGNIRELGKLQRNQPYRVMLDWKDHEGWNEKRLDH